MNEIKNRCKPYGLNCLVVVAVGAEIIVDSSWNQLYTALTSIMKKRNQFFQSLIVDFENAASRFAW